MNEGQKTGRAESYQSYWSFLSRFPPPKANRVIPSHQNIIKTHKHLPTSILHKNQLFTHSNPIKANPSKSNLVALFVRSSTRFSPLPPFPPVQKAVCIMCSLPLPDHFFSRGSRISRFPRLRFLVIRRDTGYSNPIKVNPSKSNPVALFFIKGVRQHILRSLIPKSELQSQRSWPISRLAFPPFAPITVHCKFQLN
jgi:hypothetical protein